MNQLQERKLIKIVIRMGQKMSIELFVYNLCNITVNCNVFTQDYLSNYMIGGHAKVKVFLP